MLTAFVSFVEELVRLAYRKWTMTEAVTISAWIELCWGFWILSNPENGTSRILYELGGAYLGFAFIIQALIRWNLSWSNKHFGLLAASNALSQFTFALMLWSVGVAQGWNSWLTILYMGFCSVQCYAFKKSLATLHVIETNKPPKYAHVE
jgi:hypothetical protein